MTNISAHPRLAMAAAVVGVAVLAGCANPGPRYSSQPAPYPSGQPVPPYSGPPTYPASGQPTYPAQRAPQPGVSYGYVEHVELVKAENQTSGAGAVIGGVLGAVVGRQIGSGSGRTAATAAGAIGGALVGNQIEKNQKASRDFVRVTVRLDNGGTRQFDYEPGVDVRQGDRVYIQGDQLMRY